MWQFYNAYNIAIALVGIKDKEIKKKNRILQRFILSSEDGKSKVFKKVQIFMRDDFKIIIKAIGIIQKNKEENYEFGEYYKPFSVGILSWEFPEQS